MGKNEEKLINLLAKLNLIEVIGLGKIFQVDEKIIGNSIINNNAEDLVVEIVKAFVNKNRIQKRSILRFVKNIVKEKEKELNQEVAANGVEEMSSL